MFSVQMIDARHIFKNSAGGNPFLRGLELVLVFALVKVVRMGADLLVNRTWPTK
jgi:hypothetical protein